MSRLPRLPRWLQAVLLLFCVVQIVGYEYWPDIADVVTWIAVGLAVFLWMLSVEKRLDRLEEAQQSPRERRGRFY